MLHDVSMFIMHSNKLLFLWIPADINIVPNTPLLVTDPVESISWPGCRRQRHRFGLFSTGVFSVVVYLLLKLIGVAGLTSLPRVWTAFENVIHISLARRTKRFALLLWEIDHLFPPISFVNGQCFILFKFSRKCLGKQKFSRVETNYSSVIGEAKLSLDRLN